MPEINALEPMSLRKVWPDEARDFTPWLANHLHLLGAKLNLALELNQSQSGIYIDTGMGSAVNTVIPANSGIQGTAQNVLSWTPAYAGVTKDFAPLGCAN